MAGLMQGAMNAINVCLGLRKDESVLIIADRTTRKIGRAFAKAAGKKTRNVNVVILEDHWKRPLSHLPHALARAVKKADVSIALLQKVEGEAGLFRNPLRLLACRHGRHVNMPGVTEAVMKTGMDTDHRKIWKVSAKVHGKLKKARGCEVYTKNGSHLVVSFDRRHKWLNSNGDFRRKPKAGVSNLPAGEVYTAPGEVNGLAVIDGALGNHFTKKYGLLAKTPVYVSIVNSTARGISCKNKKLEKELRQHILHSDAHSSRIGEIGFGTNIFLKKPIGIFLQDEKMPTVHIAFGNPYPEGTKANWKSKIHLDALMLNATAVVDGKKILENGIYKL